MDMKKYFLLVLFFVMMVAIPAYQDDRMRIAVLDLKADGISRRTAITVSEMLRTQFVNIGKFIVVERSQMDLILKEQGFQMTGCTEQACAVKVGKIISAQKILIGRISPLGTSIILNVRIVDVETGISSFAATESSKSIDLLFNAVSRITEKLVAGINRKKGSSFGYKRKRPMLESLGNFTDSGDGTVTDSKTGLVWQKCTAELSGIKCTAGLKKYKNWHEAASYCNSLTLAGRVWRLPRKKELESILDMRRKYPTIDAIYFPNTSHTPYWTSNVYEARTTRAWTVDFGIGFIGTVWKKHPAHVRCVSGQ
jgi:TolB-like protein